MLAVDRVVRRRLEDRDEVVPARDQADVDRLHVATPDQPQTCIPGRRDEIPLPTAATAAGSHQRDHLVRGAGILAVDLAAGLLLELLRKLGVRVVRPLDQVERAFALSDRGRTAGGRRAARRLAAAPAATSGSRGGQRSGQQPEGRPRQVALANSTHASPPVGVSSRSRAPGAIPGAPGARVRRGPRSRTSRGSGERRRARLRRRGRRRSG